MAAIVDHFIEFINDNASQFGNSVVDITPLQEKIMDYTPITLKYSDPQTAFSAMPATIIINLCKYSDAQKYPIDVLNIIKRIISKDADDEDAKIQQTLMMHMTKLKLPIHRQARLYERFENMTMKIDITDQIIIWKDLALKVLGHTQINETINQLMKDFLGADFSERIEETGKIPVAVGFVNTTEVELRGFAGLDCIYINEKHFQLRTIQSDTLPVVQRTNALLIDIATVALHEYADVRIRQVLDDMNMSTPACIVATASTAVPEFGRITERTFFKVAIDWPRSLLRDGVTSSFVETFLEAINRNSVLPKLIYNSNLAERDGSTIMHGSGTDFHFLDGSLC